ncbi:MAG: YjbF family lipoprotein, partial [Paracoccaceae bacterium]
MNRPFTIFAGLALVATVSACGTESQNPAVQVVRGVASLFQPGINAPPPGPDDLLTRDVIDQVTVPYGMIGIERRGAYASMTLAGQNGPFESWVTSDGAGVVLREDILTGTKGLGADLQTAVVTGVSAAIASNESAS